MRFHKTQASFLAYAGQRVTSQEVFVIFFILLDDIKNL